jgi:virginiamycin B lyase
MRTRAVTAVLCAMTRTVRALAATLGVALAAAPTAGAASIFTISPGRLDAPSAIAAGPRGAMWLSQDAPLSTGGGARYAIGRFDLAGHSRLFHTHAGTTGIAVTRGGTVFATERGASRIAIVSPSGNVREVATPTIDSEPLSIAIGPNGNGWFVEGQANRIGRITLAGAISEFAVPPVTDPGTGDVDDASPNEIAAGADGRLWLGIANGIATVATDGTVTEHVWSFPAFPMSIVGEANGTAWAGELEQHQLDRVAADGSATAVPFAAESPALLPGLAGTLWAFDSGNPYRWRVTPAGQAERQTLRVTEAAGKPATIRARGLQPAAPGPAGTTWLVADLAYKDGGEVDAIAVLDDSGRCIVPRLRGDSLAGARLTLANHSCRLGKVSRHNPHHLPARDLGIGRQGATPGTVLRHGARVAVTLTD